MRGSLPAALLLFLQKRKVGWAEICMRRHLCKRYRIKGYAKRPVFDR
jgi:hypothetical protein